MKPQIDESRIQDARETVDFMCNRVQPDGFLLPPEALFCETTGYQSEAAATIALTGAKLDIPGSTETARRMFDRLFGRRLDNNLWSLDSRGGFPYRHPLPENWQEQNTLPDARYTAATLLSSAIYFTVTDDDSFNEPARRSMTAMFDEWDFMTDDVIHLTREFVILSVLAWGEPTAEFVPKIEPLVQWVSESFVDTASRDFPFLTTVRTMLMLAAVGPDCVADVIAPGLEKFLTEPSWRFESEPDSFRHIKSTDDHINTRGNTAVALTFRMLDQALGTTEYTSRPLYAHLSQWIDSMRNPDGGYFECQDLETGRKWGQGCPAHYLPCGGFSEDSRSEPIYSRGLRNRPRRRANLPGRARSAHRRKLPVARRDWYCEDVLSGKLDVESVYEDDLVLAFHHPRPVAQVHVVVVPKAHVAGLMDVAALDGDLLCSMMQAIQTTATSLGLLDGRGFYVRANTASPGCDSPHALARDRAGSGCRLAGFRIAGG